MHSLSPCRGATQKCVITVPCIVDGSRISAFFRHVLHMRLPLGLAHLLLEGYRQLDAGCLGVVTNKQTGLDPYF